MPQDERARVLTLGGGNLPPSDRERLNRLELQYPYLLADVDAIKGELKQQTKTLGILESGVNKLNDDKSAAEKRKDFWMRVLVTVLAGTVLGAFGWIASIVTAIHR